ncbi:MAG: universal stress protein [Candidatus Riflebacteria bacterium]|nr:universal stress protein [Candidatus Riflebacteria bacterium]
MIKFNKILVPVDFSEGSALALRYAATFAREYGAQIHLLNVIEEEVLQAGSLGDTLDTAHKWEEQSKKLLEEFVPEDLNNLDIIKKAQGGLVSESIIEYARSNEVSLIIIGAHGKSGFIDSWLGANSYEIARKSPCAVLTVKPQARGFVEKGF